MQKIIKYKSDKPGNSKDPSHRTTEYERLRFRRDLSSTRRPSPIIKTCVVIFQYTRMIYDMLSKSGGSDLWHLKKVQ